MSPVADPRFSRSRSRADDSVYLDPDASRGEYLKPLILGGCGIVALALLALARVPNLSEWPQFIALGLTLPIQIILGIPAIIITALLFSTDAGPLHLVALRITGITLAVAPLAVWLTMIPCYGWLMTALAYATLIIWLFDFERYEAAVAVVVLTGLNFGVLLGIEFLVL